MSNQPFMQLYVGDYLADTTHLTTEQHGAYMLLLLTMWRHGGGLPNEPQKLARIARTTGRKWPAIWAEIEGFFVVEDGVITNNRLTKEYQKAVSKSELRADAGSRGGKAKALKAKNVSVANASGLLYHSSEPEPDKEKRETEVSPKNGEVLPLNIGSIDLFEPEEAPVQAKSPYSALFEQWWEAYPRATGKGAAFKAFEKQRKKFGADLLFSALNQQLPELKRSATRERGKNFCPHPSTWLNTERFNDPAHQRKKSVLEKMQEEYETDGTRQISGPS
jgi:uncharacterized protein YdaU (DUF1376 family)